MSHEQMLMCDKVTPQHERRLSPLFRNPSRQFDISDKLVYTFHVSMKSMNKEMLEDVHAKGKAHIWNC